MVRTAPPPFFVVMVDPYILSSEEKKVLQHPELLSYEPVTGVVRLSIIIIVVNISPASTSP
jgi:hypothetical protein